MHITARCPDDLAQLDRRIRTARHAKQRDRYRAVRLALDRQETKAIMAMLGRSKNFVQRWCYAYRDGGLEAVAEKPRPGRPTKLPRDQEEAFRQRMLAGPGSHDSGLCTLRGVDATRILEQQFGVHYTLDGAYDLLHRLGFACLRPRPRHRKNDPQLMQRWLDHAPLLSGAFKSSTPIGASRSGSRTRHASVSKGH